MLRLAFCFLATAGGIKSGSALAFQTPKINAPPNSEVVSFQRTIPGDSKPLRVDADQIATWSDGQNYFLSLNGKVLIEQSVLQVRADRAILCADLAGYRATGIWNVKIYGEGNCKADSSSEIQMGKKAFGEVATRGEFRFNAVKSKVEQRDDSKSTLFLGYVEARNKSIKLQEKPEEKVESKVKSPAIQKTGYQPPPVPPGEGLTPGNNGPVPPGPPASAIPAQNLPGSNALPPAPSAGPPVAIPQPLQNLQPGANPVFPAPGGFGQESNPRQYSVSPRGASGFNIRMEPLGNGEQVILVTGGVILNVKDVQGIGLLDIEADRLVIWTKGNNPGEILGNLQKQSTQTGKDLEFYLSGHVEIRQQDPARPKTQGKTPGDSRILRSDEVYYDLGRNTAIAMNAELEFYQPKLPDPIFVRAKEIQQLAANQYKVVEADIFSSKLPSDPGLKVYVAEALIEERTVPKFSLFGKRFADRASGQELDQKETYVRGRNMFIEIEDIPIFYLPYLQGDARDPLGPIEGMNLGFSNIFGGQFGLSLNTYDLLGIQPFENTRWRFNVDYMTKRGPGLGTDFDYMAPDFFGIPGRVDGLVKAYGIRDIGPDILGGNRQEGEPHPLYRGRVLWRQGISNMPYGLTFLGQGNGLSDRNFLEQFFKPEFDNDINPTTFVYLRQTQENMGWYILGEPRVRQFINEAEWLPRVEGFIYGQPLFDLFTLNAWGGAGYGRLELTDDGTPMVSPTDVNDSTGRFNISKEISAPFSLGALRFDPYGKFDLAYYTSDISDQGLGRAWGGGGLRASLPFTGLFPELKSDLFNLNGINHKVILGANYSYTASSTSYTNFPQLDRLNDDASDQALRDIRNQTNPNIYPNQANGQFLMTSPLFDPQVYAIRRAIDTRIDTLEELNVLQLDLRQRWQTKRGFPGNQHIVDWMTLDLSGSVFPQMDRDNFGNLLAFLQYDYVWNVGDRTALTSTGWVDPIENGARVFTFGSYVNRPDRTNFYLGYRQIDPVDSKALTAAVTYIFSPKYAFTGSTSYDFGSNESLSNSLVLTRVGSDLQVSLGLSYNAMQDNFGFTFEILPTLVSSSARFLGPMSGFANGGILAR